MLEWFLLIISKEYITNRSTNLLSRNDPTSRFWLKRDGQYFLKTLWLEVQKQRSSLENYTSINTTQHDAARVQHETTRNNTSTTRHNTSTIRHNTSKTQLNTSTKEARTAKIGLYFTLFVTKLYIFLNVNCLQENIHAKVSHGYSFVNMLRTCNRTLFLVKSIRITAVYRSKLRDYKCRRSL